MMFRSDRLTVKREINETVRGEVLSTTETIIEDVPCHLSVNLNTVQKQDDVPYLISDFILFLSNEADIRTDDILFVTTRGSQTYELIAGEVKFYGLSVQIKCRQRRIIEGS